MDAQTSYFSIINTRIDELKSELLKTENQIRFLSRSSKSKRKYNLKKEFILRKISYLEKIINLPLFMFINSLSAEEIEKIQSKSSISLDKNSLLKLFGLDRLASDFGKPKVMTMAYIKDTFVDDYDFMTTLLDLQNRSFDLSNRKMALCSEKVFGFKSFRDLNMEETKLHSLSENLEKQKERLMNDYSEETLKEIYDYVKNPNLHLSREFVNKFSSKVSGLNPRNAKLKVGISSLFRKLFNLKRSKKEDAFLNAIIETYKNDKDLRSFGLESIDFKNVKKSSLKNFPKRVKKQILLREQELLKNKQENYENRRITLREFQKCDAKKKKLFSMFASMLHSKCSYVPKIFENQMFNEPDLKDSLIRESCYLEEKALIQEISKQLQSQSTCVFIDSIEFDTDQIHVKELVA